MPTKELYQPNGPNDMPTLIANNHPVRIFRKQIYIKTAIGSKVACRNLGKYLGPKGKYRINHFLVLPDAQGFALWTHSTQIDNNKQPNL